MRPRSYDRGNGMPADVIRDRREASMRPRSYDRGNLDGVYKQDPGYFSLQ